MKNTLLALALVASTSAVQCQELKPEIDTRVAQPPKIEVEVPEKKLTFKERHPAVYLYSAPIRVPAVKAWNGCIWLGHKCEPIQPFLNVCSAAAGIAAPFVFGFTRK